MAQIENINNLIKQILLNTVQTLAHRSYANQILYLFGRTHIR